jgi:hypothetical protein
MARLSHLAETACGRLGILARTQQHIARLALSIHGPLAVVPRLVDPAGRLRNVGGLGGVVPGRSTPLIQFWSRGLAPAKPRRMVDPHAPCPPACVHVASAQRLTQRPPHGAEDHVGCHVAPCAQSRLMR